MASDKKHEFIDGKYSMLSSDEFLINDFYFWFYRRFYQGSSLSLWGALLW